MPPLVAPLTQMELARRPRRQRASAPVAPRPALANTERRDRALPRRARASCFSLGAGRAVLVQDGPRALERAVLGADAATETFKLLLQLRGQARLSHCGRRAVLEPGDAVLIDGAQSFRLELEPSY